jgi:hypothetical protein
LDPDPDQFHQCTITATVTAASAGIWTNTTGAPSATGPVAVTGVPSNPDTVTVLAPPSTTKSFYPASIPTSGYSKLTIKIHNPDDFVMNNVAFTDAMPASLIIVTPTDVTNSCGGTVTAAAGTSSVSLSGGSIVAIGDCSITVTVQGTAPGSWVNTTSNVTATVNAIALTGKPASATLQVGEAPNAYFVRYASNLPVGDAVVNITNVGIGSSLPGIPGAQNGNICANVYTYSPDEQLVSCCSCLVTPNGLNSLSVNGDLTSNTLTPIRPSAVVIKLVASTPVGGTCNPATVTRTGSANFLASGLAAWGTSLHALPITAGTPAGTYGITETPFTDATLSNAELTRMTQLCGFIQANGSGYGICKSCKIGGLGAAKK